MKPKLQLPVRFREPRGQSLVEFAVVLPLLIVLGFGVAEVGYLLLDHHVVSKLSREGSNLISRNTTLEDATTTMRELSSRPVDFSTRSKVIFSVLKKGATSGTGNYDRIFLYQRAEYGSLSATSALSTAGGGSFNGPPDYQAVELRQQHRASGHERPGRLDHTERRNDLRHGNLHVTRRADAVGALWCADSEDSLFDCVFLTIGELAWHRYSKGDNHVEMATSFI